MKRCQNTGLNFRTLKIDQCKSKALPNKPYCINCWSVTQQTIARIKRFRKELKETGK